MKAILNQLKKQRAKLVKASEKRDKYFMKRTEAWQNGASGTLYEMKTQELAEIITKLDATITELDNHLNDC